MIGLVRFICRTGLLAGVIVFGPDALLGQLDETATPTAPAPTITQTPEATPTVTATPFYGECQIGVMGVPVVMRGADLDNDGHQDAAFLTSQGTSAFVLLTNASLHAGMCPASLIPANVQLATDLAVALTTIPPVGTDANVDLAVAQSRNGVAIIQNSGNAQFQAGEPITINATADDARSVVAGRFNDDTFQDVAIGTYANSVSILFGQNGGFNRTPQTIAVGVPVDLIAAADLNLDSYLDLVVMSGRPPGSNRTAAIRVLLNNSPTPGQFRLIQEPFGSDVPTNPVALAIGDFDGNDRPDIAVIDGPDVLLRVPPPTVAKTATPTQSVTRTNTVDPEHTPTETPTVTRTGTRETPTPTQTPTDTPTATPTATRTTIPEGALEIFLALATTQETQVEFVKSERYRVGRGPSAVVAADLDGDDKLDAAVTSITDDRVVFFQGVGDGTFAPYDPCYTDACKDDGPRVGGCCVGIGPRDLLVALIDENGNPDSRPDLLVANADSQNISVLLSSAPGPTATVTPTRTGTITNTPGPTRTFTDIPPNTVRPTATCPQTGICVQGDGCAQISAPQRSWLMLWPWVGVVALWAMRRRRG